jgi:invasin-like protein/Big-like domain-containing protein/calcineurin-like phosphoesterase family protein
MRVSRWFFRQFSVILLVLAAATCSDNTGLEPSRPERTLLRTPTGLETTNPPKLFVGAGDISSCSNTGDSQTATLLDAIPYDEVFALGDNVYQNGTTAEFANCYEPTWGRHKARTHPAVGNHEYNTTGAAPYYNYFGAAAGSPGQGYYSFDLGQWHVIVLNSNINMKVGSPQLGWLQADLAGHPNLCTVAYFHHPLYSSTDGTGSGGVTYPAVRPLYDALYAAGADLILAGHRHFYERVAPIKPDGTRDDEFGLREIIVGSGGIGGGSQTNIFPQSQVRNGSTLGVLKLYLYDDSYAWEFVPVAGKTFSDTGSTACHRSPGGGAGGSVSASRSTVSASPASITASNGASASAITVTAKDANGNPVSGAAVVLSAPSSGNTLTQPVGTTNSSGLASGTFSSTAAGTHTVSATISGVAVTQTASVTVNPSSSAALAFTAPPTDAEPQAIISPAVKLEIRDQFGNKVTSATNGVTVAIGTNPSSGVLGGTTTVAALSGVATFSTLTIDKAGTGYTLVGSAAELTSATSSTFDIAAVSGVSASRSTIAAAPSSMVAGSGSSTLTVTAKDDLGHPVSGATVVLAATGSGNILTQPSGPTNASGVATGSLSSTVAETKTVSATANGTPLSQTATVTLTAAPPPGITHTLLTAGNVLTNQNLYTTAAITPAPNTLVTIALLSHRSTAPISPTVSGGGMASWTLVASVDFDSLSIPHRRLSIYRAMSASPGSGPITFAFGSQVSNVEWIVSQWDGVETSGVNGAGAIGQSGSNRADATNALSVALAPFGNANNVALGAFAVNSQVLTITPGSGFSEIEEQPANEGTRGDLQAEWAVNRATVTASWSNLRGGALGIEIKARAGS